MRGAIKLKNPQAGLAFDLQGPDAHALPLSPPPAFASAEIAAELVELYWQALTRDVPFSDYPTNPLIAEAAAELSALEDFTGPKVVDARADDSSRVARRSITSADMRPGGLAPHRVTPATLFRGDTAGDPVTVVPRARPTRNLTSDRQSRQSDVRLTTAA